MAENWVLVLMGATTDRVFESTQLKIAQVVTALLLEQWCNNTVIMVNNVVHYCFNNVVQH